MGRFVCKAGLEVLASRVLDVPNALDDLVNDEQLDELRRFVRVGDAPRTWPLHVRRIYEADRVFPDDDGGSQILHEYMLHYTPWEEAFFVLALFGHEFAVNIGGPDISGYERWLQENDEASPLWPDGLPDEPLLG